MGDDGVKSKDLAVKAQKKILGKMSNKSISKRLIDDKTSEFLDEIVKIRRTHTKNKKESEKLIQNIIKIIIKVAILHRNEQFSSEELKLADKLEHKTRTTAMTIVSFCEVEFTFDKFVLSKQINEGRAILQQLVAVHLTDKSKNKINSIFDQLGDAEFLEVLFDPNGPHCSSLKIIASTLNDLLESGTL